MMYRSWNHKNVSIVAKKNELKNWTGFQVYTAIQQIMAKNWRGIITEKTPYKKQDKLQGVFRKILP